MMICNFPRICYISKDVVSQLIFNFDEAAFKHFDFISLHF